MGSETDKKFVKMTTEPIPKLILSLAGPTIISMLVSAVYNLADTFFVRQLGSDSMVAAVGIAMPLMNIIQAFGFFFGHGSGNYISRALGRKDKKEAETMAVTGFVYAVAFGILIAVLGLIFNKQLAVILGAKTEATIAASVSYMRFILLATPFMAGSFLLNNQLRLQGNAFIAMIGIASGALLNVALDPIFIFTLNMGVAGAAAATAISQVIGFFVLLVGMFKSDNVRIKLRNFSKNPVYLKRVAEGGLPSLARQGLASVAVACLNHAIGLYISGGDMIDAVQAAMTGTSKIMMFFMAIMIGFGQGFQPVCGFNYGAKKYDRVKEGFWFSVRFSAVALVIIAVVGFVFADQITSTFVGTSETAARVAAFSFKVQICVFPLFSFTTVTNMMLQNMGKTVPATLVAMTRQGLAFIPLIFLLPLILDPLLAIEITQAAADFAAFVVAIPFAAVTLRKLGRNSNK